MRLAIVGSSFDHTKQYKYPEVQWDVADTVRDAIFRLNPECVVSGGADGVDHIAATIAYSDFSLPVIECQPGGHGWDYYKVRNLYVAEICDYLVRIVLSTSTTYGSGWTRDQAEARGKPTEEYIVPVPNE